MPFCVYTEAVWWWNFVFLGALILGPLTAVALWLVAKSVAVGTFKELRAIWYGSEERRLRLLEERRASRQDQSTNVVALRRGDEPR